METPPPLPKSGRKTVIVAGIIAVLCVAAAICSLFVTELSKSGSRIRAKAQAPHSSAASHDFPLRTMDVDKLATEYQGDQDYFAKVERATLAQYDRTNAATEKWFVEGRQAARLFSLYAVWDDFYEQGILQAAKAYASAAWEKGCRDPLVETICDVQVFAKHHSNCNSGAQSHISNTRHLLASQYPALFKLIAFGSALKDLIYTQNDREGLHDDLGPSWAAIPSLAASVGEPFATLLRENIPADILFVRTCEFFHDLQDGECLVTAENEIEGAFAHENPTHPARAALRGDFLRTWAWQARGSGWANTVKEDGWRKMAERLGEASEVLTAAYDKDPSDYLAATEMIGVELGQGQGGNVMETWFERAMKDHPDNYAACKSKAWYLQPRWYGSGKAVLEFGIECVKTGNWRGKLPLILPSSLRDVTDSESLYSDEPIWKLVKPVFETFLQRYPDSIGVRTSYADWAARGGHIDVLKAELTALGPNWDRDFWSIADYQRVSRMAGAQ